jgi:hypothetical protein
MLPGFITADKANRLDSGIIAQVIDCLRASMNHTDNSRWNACLFRELNKHGGCTRVAFGRLDEQCVAAGDRDGEGPKRNHG